VLAGLALVLVLAVIPGEADAVSVGRIIYASGEVWVERGNVREAAESGRRLLRNDVVVTGERGRAKLAMVDGTRVYVGSRSRIEVADYATSGRNLLSGMFNMFWGKARFFVNKLVARNAGFRVRTATAVLGVRGTSFVVNVPMPPQLEGKESFALSFDEFARLFPMPVKVVQDTGRLQISLPSGQSVELIPGRTAEIGKDGSIRIHRSPKGGGLSVPIVLNEAGHPEGAVPLPPVPGAGHPFRGGAGGALGRSSGSASNIGTAITNAKQNLGVTTNVTINPRFVLP